MQDFNKDIDNKNVANKNDRKYYLVANDKIIYKSRHESYILYFVKL